MFASATKPSLFPAIDNLGLWYRRITMALAGAWAAHRIYIQFSGLSDSQLAARGMTREDVRLAMLRALDGPGQ